MQLRGLEAQLSGLRQKAADPLLDLCLAVLSQAIVVGQLDERAAPDLGPNDTLLFEELDCARGRIAIDPRPGREIANGRDTVTGLEGPDDDQPPELPANLEGPSLLSVRLSPSTSRISGTPDPVLILGPVLMLV